MAPEIHLVPNAAAHGRQRRNCFRIDPEDGHFEQPPQIPNSLTRRQIGAM